MAHHTPTPLRATGTLLRALLGTALLVALVGGVPYLLLKVGHQPTELSGGFDLLMQQDDGSLFLVVLTCIGWAGWAAFTFSVLVESVAVLRRRSAPKIKGLGGLQSLASFLIGGIVLLAPTAASAATVTPAVAATAVQTVGEAGTSATPSGNLTTAAEEADWPQHTVASTSELPWDLAEEYLGDGKRWKDIAALNPEIPQLAAGDQYLPKGAVLKLPADARPVAPATSPAPTASKSPAAEVKPPTPPAQDEAGRQDQADGDRTAATDAERPESVTVQEGDSLWSIADTYGEPTQWPAIYDANKGEGQPGGGHFNDPNLIYPGQELDLPQTGEQPEKPAASDKESDDAPEAEPDNKIPDRHEDQAEQSAPPPATPNPSRTTEPSPNSSSTPTPAPSTQDSGRDQTPAAQQREEGGQALAPAAVWMGAGALAAALVTTLATRRILQQRRRRPGWRIPMPQGRAAATEQGLRAAQHPTGFDLLGTALRCLALNLAAAGRELPVLEAVVLHESKVELHLDQDTAPMKPFAATAGRKDVWTCAASSPDLTEEVLKDADTPYPALVSIGWDAQGRLVLVDLEHVGILHLAGDADFARHVLQAIAVELASTPLPGHLEVTALADTAPGLDDAAPERVARIDDLTDATADIASHTTDQRRALAAIGASSLRAARLMDDAGGAWTPHILLAQEVPDDDTVTELFDTLTEKPRTAGAVITSSTTIQAPAEAWTLECQSTDEWIMLPGSNLPIRLQGLSDAHFADAIELLTLAASDTDVPAPDWTRTDPVDEEDELAEDGGLRQDVRVDDQDLGEDGLPAEYAELKQDALADEDTDAGEIGAAEAPEASDENPARVVDLAKTDTDENTKTKDAAPTAGPSLADVLATEDDDADGDAAAKDTAEGQAAPSATAPPTAGPAEVALAPATPCATPTPPAVHVTIPAPAPAAEVEPADSPKPAAQQAPPTAAPDLPVETADSGTPAVLLLGPISVEGATGRIDSNRLSIGTELIAYLALNPGVDHHAIDDALWPGRLVNKQMRNAVISRTRSWLGKDTDNNAHLPRVQDTGDSRYRLGPAVACDWTRFQRFARTGLARHDEDGDLALRRALALVRGRPFTGIDPQRYAWAEPLIQEMVSAVVDVAYELSTRRREADDIPGALWAARRGLLAAEESEMLHRQIFLAHHAAGDIDALREAAAQLVRINEQLGGGVDMEAETAELLRNLLPRPITRAR
ncbi:LysM peptidoglycan-binding domain-containing protein [Streptomyces sp. NBC_01142]|uniref:LysM peptidoglycan-binding domain-containing protein n=1 Tax=Streptomyces sp. NBC_01142 TaxID=2975865 RepID=UPI00225A5FF2|nr:LysM peptidoglycan-binding domain-containing protein [Streptomyces sp. NBC_01142]MCX4826205.1 LysM peptidoglycan-binding domain-containing protein [Streptomyces sp. NBC_01142]